MDSARIVAPAKLNLFLHITGRRGDGYHLIESLAAFTAFGDMLEFAPSDTLSLEVEGRFAGALGNAQDNLVLRAATALLPYRHDKSGARITLHKHIPIGAGLGGGSSDAAAALLGLAQFWQLKVSRDDLYAIARSLGSDVPVCLARQPSWVAGAGEQVHPVAMPVRAWVVLVNPLAPLMTADVYRRFSGVFQPPATPPAPIRTLPALVRFLEPLGNALEAPAVAMQPAIETMLASLRHTEGCLLARMSGSGATCFGLFEEAQYARQAAHALRRAQPSWWVQETEMREGA